MGAISPSTGRTLPDRYIEGTCPICGYDGARGDQCDNCGNQLDADRPDQPAQPDQRRDAGVRRDRALLPRPAGAGRGARRVAADPHRLAARTSSSSRLNLLDDLRPRAMTRDIDWGIPVPLPGWEDNPNKRLYVWFDAVIGYLSASIEWARRSGDPDAWRAWWNDPDARSYYFMGKDNITFHAQIWPAELLGYDGKGARGGAPGSSASCNLPTEVCRSEFLTMEGGKFSSSRGVVIYVRDMLARYQPDALRYFISVGRAGEPGHRLHLGRVRPAHQRRAGRRLGQPGQPHGEHDRQELRRDPASRRRSPTPTARCSRDRRGVRRGRRTCSARTGRSRRSARRCGSSARRTSTSPTRRRGSSRTTTRSGWRTVLHVAAQAVSDCRTLLSPFLPSSRADGARGAGRHRHVSSPMPRDPRGRRPDGGPAYPMLTGRLLRAPRVGVRRRSCRARRCRRRRRSSPSSTRRWSTRSWPGSSGPTADPRERAGA